MAPLNYYRVIATYMNFLKNNIVGLVAIVIALAGLYFPVASTIALVGGVTNYDEVDATALKIGGANGSRMGPLIASQCSFTADMTVTATSTVQIDCAVTGVVAGDRIFAQLATSTAQGGVAQKYGGWNITNAMASSTSGFVTLTLANNTGISAIPSASGGMIGSTTNIWIAHPVTSVPGL